MLSDTQTKELQQPYLYCQAHAQYTGSKAHASLEWGSLGMRAGWKRVP